MGPAKSIEAIGRFGSFKPHLARRIDRATAFTASSCPMTHERSASSMLDSTVASSAVMRCTGMPLQAAAMCSISSTSTTWGPHPSTSNASTPFSTRLFFTSSSRARSKLASSNRPSRMRSSFIELTSLSWRHWSICSMDAASMSAPLASSLSFVAMYASMRAFDPASSIRSMALSGRNRSAMYRCEMATAASSAASV